MNPAEEAILDLRSVRGREQVTLNDVADHLHEFYLLHPDQDKLVGDLALYLAEAELRPHRHDGRLLQEELLDLASDQSFPASDPPSTSVPEY